MNKKLLTITGTFSFIFLMLGTLNECGDFGSTLILKPYPSFEKSFGFGEERQCKESLPNWVINENYLKIAYYPGESSLKLWQFFYMVFNITTFFLLIVSLVSFVKWCFNRQNNSA